MKKLLLAPMLLMVSSITFVQAATYEEQAREEMQVQEQIKACEKRVEERATCSYDVIKKVSCDPILIGGALNPCTITEKGGKKQGRCTEEPSAGGASTDYVLICK